MSNADVKYNSTPNFSGPGWSVNAVEGCKASAGHCDIGVPYNYNMLPATNPLKVLDTASFNTTTGSTKPCNNNGKLTNNDPPCTLNPLSTAYGNLTVNGSTLTFNPGTYFFRDAAINFTGGIVNGTGVTLVLLGNSSLTINGATVNLSAPAINTTSSLLNGVLIDYQGTKDVTITGTGNVKLGGAMYFPKADVKWAGTAASDFTTCSMVIANTLTINGNAYLSTNGCDPDLKDKFKNTVVALVEP
jgi:hypothetical protein